MKNIKDSLRVTYLNNPFIRNVGVLAGATVIGQGVALLMYPLLTRLYSPSDFGILGIYTSLLSLATVVASFRYEMAIPLADNTEDAVDVVRVSLIAVLITTTFSGCIVGFFGDEIANGLNIESVKPYLWLLPIGVLGAGVYQVFTYWAIRQTKFRAIGRTKVTQSIGQVVTQSASGIVGIGAVGLLVGQVIGQTLGSFVLSKGFFGMKMPRLSIRAGFGLRKMLIRFRKFPLISCPSALLNSAGLQIPTILFAAFYHPMVAGWFNFSQRIIALPISLIGTAVAQVYLSEASKLVRYDPKALRSLFTNTAKRLLLVGGVPAVFLGSAAPWIFQIVFGQRWHEAGRYVQVMMIAFVAQFVVVPLSQTLNVMERLDVQLSWDIGRLIMVVGSLVMAHFLNLGSLYAVTLYSGCMFVSYVVLFLLSLYGLKISVVNGRKTWDRIHS